MKDKKAVKRVCKMAKPHYVSFADKQCYSTWKMAKRTAKKADKIAKGMKFTKTQRMILKIVCYWASAIPDTKGDPCFDSGSVALQSAMPDLMAKSVSARLETSVVLAAGLLAHLSATNWPKDLGVAKESELILGVARDATIAAELSGPYKKFVRRSQLMEQQIANWGGEPDPQDVAVRRIKRYVELLTPASDEELFLVQPTVDLYLANASKNIISLFRGIEEARQAINNAADAATV